jgi:hypothetical protein
LKRLEFLLLGCPPCKSVFYLTVNVSTLETYFRCNGYRGYRLVYSPQSGFTCVSPCSESYCHHGGQCQHLPNGPRCRCVGPQAGGARESMLGKTLQGARKCHGAIPEIGKTPCVIREKGSRGKGQWGRRPFVEEKDAILHRHSS